MGFFEWFRTRSDSEPPPPPEPECGPAEDDWAGEVPPEALRPVDEDKDGTPDSIAGICLAINYVDGSGARSSRRVICESVYEENDIVYLSGHCLLRDDYRTFRVDRIQKLRIPPSWILVANPAHFLRSYLSVRSEKKAEHDWQSFAEESQRYGRLYEGRNAATHGLRVLTFVARADGAFVAAEFSVVKSYVREAAGLVGTKLGDDDCSEIAADVERLFPTKRQVTNSLATIRHYHEQSDIFLSALKAPVSADGERSSREEGALAMLVEILRKQEARGR